MRRAFLLGAVLALAFTAGGCGTKATKVVALELPSTHVRFADPAAEKAGPTVPYSGPSTPHSLDGVKVAKTIGPALAKAGVTEALTSNGFAVVPDEFPLFHFAYQGNVYEGWPLFVTTDVAYHQWHLLFDKMLRSLEQEVLLPKLEQLVRGLVDAAQAQTAELAGTPLEDAASRVEQLFQVAAAELGLPVTLGPLAIEEKALIDAHSASDQESPIVGGKIDYSLFTPRGHYTRNAALGRFFTAMSVLGQSAFCLPGTTDCPGTAPVRMAVLAARVLVEDPELIALWRTIYEPTAFLVGLADDYTPLELADAVRTSLPGGLKTVAALADDAVVKKVIEAVTAARPVLISPDRAAVRFMGTRFVLDSFVLDQLLSPNVGSRTKERLIPSGLDLAAAFGSDFARGVLEQAGETAYTNYDAQLDALRTAIAERPVAEWSSTVYDAWLHALAPSFAERGAMFPDFMQSETWTAKAHQSGLGSYAELKHDTILFSKQAVAEGGDDFPIPARRNWVEPEPLVYARLAAAADLLRRGLKERDLLTPEQAELLRDEIGVFRFFERIARDELAGKPISANDNERLTYIGEAFEAFFWRTSDRSESGVIDADKAAAIVADIASGPKGVLEVGTGAIDRLYVLVPDDEGRFQVAVGGVYSYYEFTNPPGERLTDEAWRALLRSGDAPARPSWEEAFLAG